MKSIAVLKSFTSLILFTIFFICGLTHLAQAQNSGELSCRMKAKEIAAENYKNCMTDHRQSQLEIIRKDYKEKLSELKSHYDDKLKRLSGGGAPVAATAAPQATSSDEMSKPILRTLPSEPRRSARAGTRASGARNLPMKKGPIKSQSIDLATPAATGERESVEAVQSENRLKNEQDGPNDIEVVDIPSQE